MAYIVMAYIVDSVVESFFSAARDIHQAGARVHADGCCLQLRERIAKLQVRLEAQTASLTQVQQHISYGNILFMATY